MDRSRFVVLKHTQPASQIPLSRRQYLAGEAPNSEALDVHFDLMLEFEGGLLTFALAKLPSIEHPELPALKLPPHREAYLQYEGPVSGGRGVVDRVMSGTFALLEIPPMVSLSERFESLTVLLSFDDAAPKMRLAIKRVQQEKFQIICSTDSQA